MNVDALTYVCDDARHLVCLPYSVENLHRMAAALGIKRCWFHASSRHPHYDVPKRRIDEIRARCVVVSSQAILAICRGETTVLGERIGPSVVLSASNEGKEEKKHDGD